MAARGISRWARVWACLACALSLTALTAEAQAQFGPGGGMGPGFGGNRPKPEPKQKPKQDPDMPETHAASGSGDSMLPQGSEPTLPEKPLEISESVAKRIGTDKVLDEPEVGRGEFTERDFYGLWYQEKSDDYQLKMAFPVWLERTQPSLTDPTKLDRASLFGGIYYNRRSAERSDDVVFPAFWNLQDKDSRTTVVGPLVNRVAPDETDNWLAPLYFFGTRKHGSYQIIPPLLTYLNHDDEGGFNLIGPGFCSFDGSSACFGNPKSRDLGLFPLWFQGYDETSDYRLILPLLHYHENDEKELSTLDIWGPFYRESTEERELLHLLPFYWSIWGKNERHTTLLPFFHYGWKGNSSLFVNPLFMTSTSEEGYKTFATWGYARYRGRTELDMYTPLLWLYRDPDAGIDQKLLFPFYYEYTSPREDSWALFPFYGQFERHGVSNSTWITPLFNHTHSLTGWSTNLYPIAFFGRERHSSHSVVAPIFWDFSSPSSRSTVAFPVYWRFAGEDSLTQLIGNVLYTEKQVKHGLDWKVHLLPALSYGETPDGHSWDILLGLVGYKRRGDYTALKLFWATIPLSGELD